MIYNLQHRSLSLAASGLLLAIGTAVIAAGGEKDITPASGVVKVNAEFPGGNIDVERNEPGVVHVAPDLRGDRPWFYWYFEATATKPGQVTFIFPEKVAGFKNGAISLQGPAISEDGSVTWRWMGKENVHENAFFYDFTNQGEAVRFAVTIPYVESDLKKFLKANAKNRHLSTSLLTKSQQGREVELLQIGEPGTSKQKVLITARHHAAETMASFVFEGFLQEAISESPAGEQFRKRFVLYSVPLVDKDGVEVGDQGKNRQPHDHNRDYGLSYSDKSIYPEVQAIKDLDQKHHFHFALDFHCPTLVMEDHQVMYFVGAKEHPRHNLKNVTMFAKLIQAGLPKDAPHGPLVWLRDEHDRSPKNSRYFAFQKGVIMSATLEFPFAPPGKATDPASCRKYGAAILRAFVETHFIEGEE